MLEFDCESVLHWIAFTLGFKATIPELTHTTFANQTSDPSFCTMTSFVLRHSLHPRWRELSPGPSLPNDPGHNSENLHYTNEQDQGGWTTPWLSYNYQCERTPRMPRNKTAREATLSSFSRLAVNSSHIRFALMCQLLIPCSVDHLKEKGIVSNCTQKFRQKKKDRHPTHLSSDPFTKCHLLGLNFLPFFL